VFEFLLASSGAIALLVYLVIAFSQLRMRKQRMARGEKIAFSMWLFPGLTYAVIVFIVGALTIMLFQEAHRVEILATGLLSLLVVAAGLFVARRRRKSSAALRQFDLQTGAQSDVPVCHGNEVSSSVQGNISGKSAVVDEQITCGIQVEVAIATTGDQTSLSPGRTSSLGECRGKHSRWTPAGSHASRAHPGSGLQLRRAWIQHG